MSYDAASGTVIYRSKRHRGLKRNFQVMPLVVRAILTHLGRWQPKAVERAPPVPPGACPAHASLPLTYHSVPDIA